MVLLILLEGAKASKSYPLTSPSSDAYQGSRIAQLDNPIGTLKSVVPFPILGNLAKYYLEQAHSLGLDKTLVHFYADDVDPRSSSFKKEFELIKANGFNNCEYVQSLEGMGNLHALGKCLDQIKASVLGSTPVLVTTAGRFTNLEFAKLVETHRSQLRMRPDIAATMAIKKVDDSDIKALDIEAYVINARVVKPYVDQLLADGRTDVAKDLLPLLIKNKLVAFHELRPYEFSEDLEHIEDQLKVTKAFLSAKVLGFEPNGIELLLPNNAKVWIGKGVHIPREITIKPNSRVVFEDFVHLAPQSVFSGIVYVHKGCKIKEACYVENSIIHPFTKLSTGVTVKSSIVGSHSKLGLGSYIENLVVAAHQNLSAKQFMRIMNDAFDYLKHREDMPVRFSQRLQEMSKNFDEEFEVTTTSNIKNLECELPPKSNKKDEETKVIKLAV